MKKVSRLLVLIASIPFMLSSCEELKEKKVYCLESFDQPEYESGMCYQASKEDALESVHLIYLPPTDAGAKSDLEWNSNIALSCFTFTDGLVGKKVQTVLTLSNTVIRLVINGRIEDPEATFGYIKVNRYAFKAKTEKVKEAYLYAYVAIGSTPGVVKKPSLEQDETKA